ncbi:MAG TPA: primosomal protein N' [Kiritimatiellia bacterium]|nr:primosomal protein N' [Kiritimatiellia bacterium]
MATEVSVGRLFDYRVPDALAPRLAVGQRVRVPFGGRTLSAYVVALEAEAAPAIGPSDLFGMSDGSDKSDVSDRPRPGGLRAILAIEDEAPFLSPVLLELARWMADYTCATFELALRCMLPAAVRNRTVKAKERLYVTPCEGTFDLTPRQAELLANLRRVGGGWLNSLTREFACTPQTLKTLAEKGAAVIAVRQMRRDPLANRTVLPTRPLPLMPEQAAALAQVIAAVDAGAAAATCAAHGRGLESGARASSPASADTWSAAGRSPGVSPAGGDARAPDLVHVRAPAPPKPVLLFGVTGSGKTEVYLQAIAHALQRGLGAIVLVPEIALTPQTVQRFASRFGARIAVLHSALSDGERYDEWHRIRNGEAVVVVGPRSAVFAPVRNLGLIVVDEEHEPSYKQDEAPRYNARDAAVMRGWMERCAVVLGSATPAMESWLNVEKGKYVVAHLTRRVAGRPMPRVNIVDMRVETAKAGHVQIFSGVLLEALKLRLERGEQSILFLNRRGYATSLVCPKCGAVAECPSCSVAYTYHQADTCLRCHICGGWRPLPEACPGCGDRAFKFTGFGTQRVEIALKRCFPQARVLRMDADVTARKNSHDELLADFKSGRADILIGTQMIAKGLDFPNVTLVGVLAADASLHMPDFRAAERTYQLLAQVSGRAGRAELPGEVYVQTFSPDHPAVRAAASDEGFAPFAAAELAERRAGGYPPYTHLACVTFKGPDEAKVRFVAESVERGLRRALAGTNVLLSEACPAPLAKAKDHYRYQLLLRAPTARAITRPLCALLAKTRLAPDVALAIDVDALSLM